MDTKELRKELKTALEKAIHETLIKRNALAGSKIKKAIKKASGLVAKKFYKAIKVLSEKEVLLKKKPAKKKSSIKKVSVKKKSPGKVIVKKRK